MTAQSTAPADVDPDTEPEPPELEIGLPDGFRDLPLAADPAEWEREADEFLAMVPVERPEQHRQLALAHLRAYAGLLRAGGVVKALAYLAPREDGGLTTASVLVSWQPAAPAAPADVVAMGLLAALTERHPDREVYGIELPIGPAVAMICERHLRGTAPDGQEIDLAVRSIEVSVPIEDEPWVLVVALSSPTLADWDDYQAIAATLCRSIRVASG